MLKPGLSKVCSCYLELQEDSKKAKLANVFLMHKKCCRALD